MSAVFDIQIISHQWLSFSVISQRYIVPVIVMSPAPSGPNVLVIGSDHLLALYICVHLTCVHLLNTSVQSTILDCA